MRLHPQIIALVMVLLHGISSADAVELCTFEDLIEKDARLPALLPIEEGASPEQVLLEAFGCDLVTTGTNRSEALADLIRSQQSGDEALIGTAQEAKASIQQAALAVKAAEGAMEDLEAGITIAHTNAANVLSLQRQIDRAEEIMREAEGAIAAAQSSIKVANLSIGALWLRLEDVFDRGLLPSRRIVIQIESEPEGAAIVVEGEKEGTTTIRAQMREDAILSMRLEHPGYEPCGFGDGSYRPADQPSGSDARFYCQLKRP